MKNDNGYTLLELVLTLAMLVILIGMSVIYLLPYNERNEAIQVRSEAQLALDTSSAYLLSTSNYRKSILSEKLRAVLENYSDDKDAKLRFEIIEVKDGLGNIDITIYLYAPINENFDIKAKIDPETDSMTLQGIGSSSSIDSLRKSGVLDL